MTLSTHPPEDKTERWTFEQAHRIHSVSGLPEGVKAVVIEQDGKFFPVIVGCVYRVPGPPPHDSLESALAALKDTGPSQPL